MKNIFKKIKNSFKESDWKIIIPVILIGLALILFLVSAIMKLLWAWTVPDLFPGAVEQGLVAESISWYTALKLAIFVAAIGGLSGSK